mmetsp:Transcript_12161/g.10785  ORF Transcript_12161/g.10785 Transcript_12161/m.10785 type:complete len:111 (+) Transcript_12161:50-382(+)
MRTAYYLSSYLYFDALTTPSPEWIDKKMMSHGIDITDYSEFTNLSVLLLAVLLIGTLIGELKSHRFYIAQTYEESKYPYKPQRCLMSLWVSIVLQWKYPDNRIIHLLLIC